MLDFRPREWGRLIRGTAYTRVYTVVVIFTDSCLVCHECQMLILMLSLDIGSYYVQALRTDSSDDSPDFIGQFSPLFGYQLLSI